MDINLKRLKNFQVFVNRNELSDYPIDRLEKIYYSRKFYKNSIFFRGILDTLIDYIGVESVESDKNIDNRLMVFLLREWFLTGEIIYYIPTEQILPSEDTDIKTNEFNKIEKIVYNKVDLNLKDLVIEQNKIFFNSLRGEPPLFIIIPKIIEIGTILASETRYADISTRLIGKIVQSDYENDGVADIDLDENFFILRTKNSLDSIEFPKINQLNFENLENRLYQTISSCVGIPKEILLNDLKNLNFSQSKTIFYVLKAEIERYRKFFEKIFQQIYGIGTKFVWPDIPGPDDIDRAKISSLEVE